MLGDRNKDIIYGKYSISVIGILDPKNVLFVDGLEVNLISISQLCDEPCLVKFINKECTVYDSTRNVVFKGIRLEDNCYCVGGFLYLVCNKTSLSVKEIQHKQLGNMNLKILKRILSLKTIKELISITTKHGHICGHFQ